MKEDFIYDEGLYIKNKDLEEYEDLMMSCDFMPEDIESEGDFNSTLEYLISLTLKSPDFLPPYEFAWQLPQEFQIKHFVVTKRKKINYLLKLAF